MRKGELVLAIDVDAAGELRLWPAADYDVTGGHDPDSWRYRLNLAGPSALTTRTDVPAASVLHLTWSRDPSRPWRGVGPIESAALAGRLSAETTKALADESSGPRGHLPPVPQKDGNDPTLELLKADLRTLNGKTTLVESMASAFNTGDRFSSPSDWQGRRIGFDAPASLVETASMACREVLAACGISPALFDAKAAAAAREAWRQLLFGTVAPLGRMVSDELTRKLETPIRLTWDELRASDLTGRSRALQSLVNAGMDIRRASTLAGLDE